MNAFECLFVSRSGSERQNKTPAESKDLRYCLMRRKEGKIWYQSIGIGKVCISAIILASFKAPWPFNLQKLISAYARF